MVACDGYCWIPRVTLWSTVAVLLLLLQCWKQECHAFTHTVSLLPSKSRHYSIYRTSSPLLLASSCVTSLSHDEISRYSRHLVLSDVGMKGQILLKEASVLVIGAGGLGSPCLMYLAAAGVGHLGIVDADTVDESNLQRQIIHSTSTLNMSKCESAKKCIQDMNPHVKVTLFEEEFTAETALPILQHDSTENNRWDVVVDGSDNFPTKYLINDACELCDIPWVYSAILAFEGQLSVFNCPPKVGPTYRDMMPEPPPPGDVPSCAEGGVLGVLPGTMGCMQATEVLKILLNRKEGLLSGRVLQYDAMKMTFSEHGLQRLSEDVRTEITGLIDYQGFCAGHKVSTATTKTKGRTMDEAETADTAIDTISDNIFHSVTPTECIQKLTVDKWTPYVLDVRLQTENDIVALPFTDHVAPHRTVKIQDIPKEGEVLLYCKAGVRGKKACQRLIDLGVSPDRLWNLEGGIMRWQKDVDPSMPRY